MLSSVRPVALRGQLQPRWKQGRPIPSPLSRRSSAAMATQSEASAEAFLPETRQTFKLDASANGCTGMYWRSRPEMGASVSAPDWPRNGAVLQGWLSKEHEGWVRLDRPEGYWLPTHQYGKQILFW